MTGSYPDDTTVSFLRQFQSKQLTLMAIFRYAFFSLLLVGPRRSVYHVLDVRRLKSDSQHIIQLRIFHFSGSRGRHNVQTMFVGSTIKGKGVKLLGCATTTSGEWRRRGDGRFVPRRHYTLRRLYHVTNVASPQHHARSRHTTTE